MINTTNALALRASGMAEAREQLIHENEQTILRTASRLCKRYISKSDDEWSVSLCAFSHAIDIYDESRGDFLPFAQMLIKRSLTDLYRSRAGERREIIVPPGLFDGSAEPDEVRAEDAESVRTALVDRCTMEAEDTLRTEILEANAMLESYGFRFYDLVTCSPRQNRSRKDCAQVIRTALQSSGILQELKMKKKLPVRTLCRESEISKKTIDRYRKYIIMAILVLEGDFPHLSEYLRNVS